MFVTFLRSSSIGLYSWCSWKYALQTQFGLPDEAGIEAQRGSIVHKSLELLARKKMSEQRGEQKFSDPELDLDFSVRSLTVDQAVDVAFVHYSHPDRSSQCWEEADRELCRKWTHDILGWGNGAYSPLQREIVAPELYFDLTIERPWARYDYTLPDGKRLTGRLAIKGTMDLVTREGPGVIHYFDWKTGKKFDWKKRREKGFDELRNEPQFLLYYYALRQLFPGEHILFTVFYVKAGGPFTLYFDDRDLVRAEAMLQEIFERIRADNNPSWVYPHRKCDYCAYDKTLWPGTAESTCGLLRREFVTLGLDRAITRYGDLSRLSHYGQGGGSSNRS